MYKKNITIDIDRPYTSRIPSVQSDNNRRIAIKLVSNGIPVNLNNVRAVLSCLKPDGNEIFNSTKTINAEEGVLEITLTEQLNAVVGQVACNLRLYGANETLVTTQEFYINVGAGVSVNKVVSSSEFKALTSVLSEVQEIDNRFYQVNVKLDEVANKGTTVETIERVTKEEITRQINDGTIANLTIADNSLTESKIKDGAVTGVKIADKSIDYTKLNPSIYSGEIGKRYNLKGDVIDSVARWILLTIPNNYGTVTNGTTVQIKCGLNNHSNIGLTFDRMCLGYTSSVSGESYQSRIPGYADAQINVVSVENGENASLQGKVNSTEDMSAKPYLIIGLGLRDVAVGTRLNASIEKLEVKVGANDWVSPKVFYHDFYCFATKYENIRKSTEQVFTGLVNNQQLENYLFDSKNYALGSIKPEHLDVNMFGFSSKLKAKLTGVGYAEWVLFTVRGDENLLKNEITLSFETPYHEKVKSSEFCWGYTLHDDETDYKLNKIPGYDNMIQDVRMSKEGNKVSIVYPLMAHQLPEGHNLILGFRYASDTDYTVLDMDKIQAISGGKYYETVYGNAFLSTSGSNRVLEYEFTRGDIGEQQLLTIQNLATVFPKDFIDDKHIKSQSVTKDKLSPDIILQELVSRVSYENVIGGTINGNPDSTPNGNILLLSRLFPEGFEIDPEHSYRVEVEMELVPDKTTRFSPGCGVFTEGYNYNDPVNQWSTGNGKIVGPGESVTLSFSRTVTLPDNALGVMYGAWTSIEEGEVEVVYEVRKIKVKIDGLELEQDGPYGMYKPANTNNLHTVFVDEDTSTLSVKAIKKVVEDKLSQSGVLSKLKGKHISFIGDSITTFKGWIPEGNAVYYSGSNCGITSVDQTWWKRTIDQIGLELCVNNAWSGSRVTTTGGEVSAGCMNRATSLHKEGQDPDIIVVYIGINDFNNGVVLGEYNGTQEFPTVTTTFREAYAIMLNKMMERYKNARIYVCTLPYCRRTNSVFFPETKNGVTLSKWNDAIRELANLFNLPVIELSKCGINHHNLDSTMGDYNSANKNGLHPNPNGMRLMANAAIKTLDPLVPYCD